MLTRPVSREGLILALLCTFDAISSAVLFATGSWVEANPLLQPYAQAGTVPFLAVKLLTYLPGIILAELFAIRRPRLVRALLRVAIVAYVVAYGCLLGMQVIGW